MRYHHDRIMCLSHKWYIFFQVPAAHMERDILRPFEDPSHGAFGQRFQSFLSLLSANMWRVWRWMPTTTKSSSQFSVRMTACLSSPRGAWARQKFQHGYNIA